MHTKGFPMRIIPPSMLKTTTGILFLSAKRARVEIRKLYTRDIYTGLLLPKDVWTLEHVVPQSRVSHPGKKNDLHNLAGLHTKINSSRGNKKFGDPQRLQPNREFKGCMVSKTLFAPKVGKGEVARKCAYMIEQYGDSVDSYNLIDSETMLRWNYIYPPGDDEKRRNDMIYEIQGTYNRFVEDSSILHETLYLQQEESHRIPLLGEGSAQINGFHDAS